MRTARPARYHLFKLDGRTFRWWTKHPWQNGTQPDHIVVDEWAFRLCPDGRPRLTPTDINVRAKVARLIADQRRGELDEYRREEASHEAMVEAYDAALVEGGEA